MKKGIRRLIVILLCVCFTIPNLSVSAQEVREGTTDIGWYVQQSVQPWTGSNWTFEYLDVVTEKFSKLETYVADASIHYWKDVTGTVEIKGWEQLASYDKYAAIAFTADKDEHVKLTTKTGTIEGGETGGQFMLVQRKGDSYHVLLNWMDIKAGDTKTMPNIEAYVKKGEIIYYLSRSTTSLEQANLRFTPQITYTTGVLDTENLYPDKWVVVENIVKEEKVGDISWYASQNVQPWPDSPFTFEYLDKSLLEFKKLETYVEADASYWQDTTGKVQVKTWQQVSTYEKYAAVAFRTDRDGKAILTSTSGMLKAGTVGGQFMLLQRKGTEYHALLDWIDVPAGQSITLPDVETYMKAGDIVYFLYRAVNIAQTTSQVVVDYVPQVTFIAGVLDTDNLYPDSWKELASAVIGDKEEMDAALEAPTIIYNPTDAKYQHGNRFYQGVPSIVKEESTGRLWATWMVGGFGEDEYNWVPLYTSKDDGETWSESKIAIDPEGAVRAFENNLWMDPEGRMWLFWCQSYYWFDGRAGVWAIHTENPEDENPTWSEPVRIADGVVRNKPVVLKNGDWILPTAIWTWSQNPELNEIKYSNAYISKDKGNTWEYLGSVKEYEGERNHDENMIIEQNDGSLRMLIRTMIGIEESYSYDGGKTWSASTNANLSETVSRFYIGRLASGNQLLVYHDPEVAGRRSHLTAAISEDDGKTWPYKIIIDERWGVSYPDVQQDKEGNIYIIYDFGRTSKSNILMAKITEKDIKAGKVISLTSRLQVQINNNTAPIASVKSESGNISEISKGMKIFSDSDAVFAENIYDWFSGKSYLCASMEKGFRAEVTSAGWLYVLTPAMGIDNSQQEKLEADGYECIIELPAAKLASTINVPLAVMAKQVKAGETVSSTAWSVLVGAPIWDDNISWYVQQVTQPWAGSYYTFEYFDVDSMEFKKLETYVEDGNPAFWQDKTGTVQIKGWEMVASDKKYAAVAFRADKDGEVILTDKEFITGGTVDGQFMVLQRSGDTYKSLLGWTDIPSGQKVNLPDVKTYVKAKDVVYYLYRSKTSETAVAEITPGVSYMIGVEDVNRLYPAAWDDLRTALGLAEDLKTYVITTNAGEGGTITKVSGSNEKGQDITYQIKATEGYEIEDVLVDGKSIGKTEKYTFTELRQNHTLEAKFKKATTESAPLDNRQTESPTGAQTGDMASPVIWAMLMIVTAGVIVAAHSGNKRKDKKEE